MIIGGTLVTTHLASQPDKKIIFFKVFASKIYPNMACGKVCAAAPFSRR
jgi:hypothetical protein